MINVAIRIFLSACVFTFLIPTIPGAHFTGAFWPDGVVYGLLMAIVVYLFGFAILAFTIGTKGFGFLLVILGFWLIPAIQLEILAHFFPQHLAFQSWGSAIVAGLVLMLVNLATASSDKKASSSDSD
jgi:hypothetical protein